MYPAPTKWIFRVSKKKSKHQSQKHGTNKSGVRQLPTVEFEDFATADQVFLAHIESGELMPRRGKEADGKKVSATDGPKTGKGPGDKTIDLHGLTLEAAFRHLDYMISAVLGRASGPVTFKIVTGRGLHSGPGGGVLVVGVHRYVTERYGPRIVSIDSSPAETQILGFPWRGHFHVTIRHG
ncbi:MAG: hypothetical protein FJ146_01050 [Deltaproteobacteria bacterium]|nr:hypothetical protein [Deltaproteobacteria bacterium]